MTVHKSQGSEYPSVILPLLSVPLPLMTRNLIYTAVTRAKSCVVIVGLWETFLRMAGNDTEQKRYSSLAEQLRDVKEREELYFEQADLFKAQLQRLAKVEGKVVVLDLRNEEIIHAGNRFMIYALYPQAEISVHVAWGFRKQNTAVMIGKSIVNKGSSVDIGDLCLRYGGGGHHNAGTCQLDNDVVDEKLPEIIRALNA